MQKIIALLIVLAGAAGGIALGVQMHSPATDPGASPEPGQGAEGDAAMAGKGGSGAADGAAGGKDEAAGDRDYVKINKQFVVPVVHERETKALMLFELALDVPKGMTMTAYAAEPRLRDAFLRVMFEMSYSGAFLTTYTDDRFVVELRDRLRVAAREILGDKVSEVLILDIMRQEF